MEMGSGKGAVGIASLLVAICAMVGCNFSESKKEAEQVAEQYFAKLQGSDIDGALALYSPRFYQVTSRADWLSFLQSQHARCGVPKSHSLVTWNVFSSMGTDSGVRTVLVYDVHYASCRVSEKLTIFKPSDGAIQIQGHFLTPIAGAPEGQATQATQKT